VTRIIAGFAGSTALGVPKSGTRPTSDRVREALFSALEARDEIEGLRVADLYAGTGALGLEAASRGASAVTLVELGAQAARVCRSNAALVTARAPRGSGPRIDVVAGSVRSYVSHLAPRSLDVVFIDPPYELSEDELRLDLEALEPGLDADALVVVERRARSGEPAWPAGLALETRKAYGDTVLWWARAASAPAE
jgi:16S rRNA (guanine966-N2)-methyltransferase